MSFYEGVAEWESLLLKELDSEDLVPPPHDGQVEAGPPTSTSDLAFSHHDRRTIVLGKSLIMP